MQYTSKHSQLVVMALKPGEEIGAEGRPVLPRGRRNWRGGCGWCSAGDSCGLRGSRSGRSKSQHHQYRWCSAKAIHALRPTEPSRRHRPSWPRRRESLKRTVRRQDNVMKIRLRVRLSPHEQLLPAMSSARTCLAVRLNARGSIFISQPREVRSDYSTPVHRFRVGCDRSTAHPGVLRLGK